MFIITSKSINNKKRSC